MFIFAIFFTFTHVGVNIVVLWAAGGSVYINAGCLWCMAVTQGAVGAWQLRRVPLVHGSYAGCLWCMAVTQGALVHGSYAGCFGAWQLRSVPLVHGSYAVCP